MIHLKQRTEEGLNDIEVPLDSEEGQSILNMMRFISDATDEEIISALEKCDGDPNMAAVELFSKIDPVQALMSFSRFSEEVCRAALEYADNDFEHAKKLVTRGVDPNLLTGDKKMEFMFKIAVNEEVVKNTSYIDIFAALEKGYIFRELADYYLDQGIGNNEHTDDSKFTELSDEAIDELIEAFKD